MAIVITTPATVFPVTTADAKAHLRVDGTDEDTYIGELVKAATGHVEAYCGRSYSAQTLTLYLDAFAPEILLLRGPVAAVSSVKYYDASGILQTVATSVYQADIYGDPATITLKDGQSWPETQARKNAVEIAYTVGSATVPDAVKMAIKLLLAHWFENREASSTQTLTDIPHGVAALLANHRSFAF